MNKRNKPESDAFLFQSAPDLEVAALYEAQELASILLPFFLPRLPGSGATAARLSSVARHSSTFRSAWGSSWPRRGKPRRWTRAAQRVAAGRPRMGGAATLGNERASCQDRRGGLARCREAATSVGEYRSGAERTHGRRHVDHFRCRPGITCRECGSNRHHTARRIGGRIFATPAWST